MYKLTERVAIVTGAGRPGGIGAAVARLLVANGARVVVADICTAVSSLPNSGNPAWEDLATVAAEIGATPWQVDITNAASVQVMIDQVKGTFGRLDILVNNAGAAVAPGPVLWMSEDGWRRTLEINATGTFLCCQKALPLMIAGQRGGRIINMASIAAAKPKPNTAAYAASKAAVVALTQALAQEVAGYGITVNAVLPGDVDTEMKQWGMQMEAWAGGREKEAVIAATSSRIPLGRLAVPADVAHVVGFLASDAADFLTGQAINVTGGRELT